MPPRYERKIYTPGGMYHLFNRGVNKAKIFHSHDDYIYFTECIMLYLIPKDQIMSYLLDQKYDTKKALRLASKAKDLKNYSNEVSLIAYCLMPNHFHFLIEQVNMTSMSRFMKSLLTRYSMYYARKYDYVGHVFQGRYKAISVLNEIYMIIVTNYIHKNPADLSKFRSSPHTYPWSSAYDYMASNQSRSWIKRAGSF